MSQAGRFLSIGGVAGAVTLTALAVMALAQLGQGQSGAVRQEAAHAPPLAEMAASKHVLRAPGAVAAGQTVRYDPGVISAFARLAEDYPVTSVTSAAEFFSHDRKSSELLSLAAVTVLPPRRPAELPAPPVSVASPEQPAAVAPAGEQEPRILTIPVPGLTLARHAVARTGEALTATASGAADIVGRGVDAGLGLIRR